MQLSGPEFLVLGSVNLLLYPQSKQLPRISGMSRISLRAVLSLIIVELLKVPEPRCLPPSVGFFSRSVIIGKRGEMMRMCRHRQLSGNWDTQSLLYLGTWPPSCSYKMIFSMSMLAIFTFKSMYAGLSAAIMTREFLNVL